MRFDLGMDFMCNKKDILCVVYLTNNADVP